MSTRSVCTSLSAALALVLAAADLPAQKKGGGNNPPANPAIAFADVGIKVMNADGTNVRTVVALGQGESAGFPSWSPNGQQLAFCGTLGGQTGIWKVNLDGTGRQFLAPQAGIVFSSTDWSPVPAPDGQHKIVFRSTGVGGDYDVFVVNTDGSGLQNLTNSAAQDEPPTWTRDATGIYAGWIDFNGTTLGARLLQLGALPGGGVTVTAAPTPLTSWYFMECQVAHDGTRLLFRGGLGPGVPTSIWSVDLTVQPWAPQLLYGDGQVRGAPSFSPDDLQLVMQRLGSGPSGGIFTANASGSGLLRIRNTGYAPRWKHN